MSSNPVLRQKEAPTLREADEPRYGKINCRSRYLQELHPPAERAQVVLVLQECHRHAQWYAPEFPVFIGITSLAQINPEALANASAVYTDNADLILPAGWSRSVAATFYRSDLINANCSQIVLYQLEQSDL